MRKINQIIRLNVTDVKEVKEMLKHYYVRPRPSPFAITLIPNNICVTPIIPCTWPVSSLADRSKRSKKYLHFHTNVSTVLNKLLVKTLEYDRSVIIMWAQSLQLQFKLLSILFPNIHLGISNAL